MQGLNICWTILKFTTRLRRNRLLAYTNLGFGASMSALLSHARRKNAQVAPLVALVLALWWWWLTFRRAALWPFHWKDFDGSSPRTCEYAPHAESTCCTSSSPPFLISRPWWPFLPEGGECCPGLPTSPGLFDSKITTRGDGVHFSGNQPTYYLVVPALEIEISQKQISQHF